MGRQYIPAADGLPRTRVASSELIGRSAEVERLRSFVARLADGHPQVVLVAGEAGFGKTRLIATVAEQLRVEKADVLVGHCLDLGPGGPPYAAITEALRAAEPVAPLILDGLTGTADVRRSQLFEGVRATVVNLARRRPVVLVVEDLHWADRATRDMLVYLLATARQGRWALVATYRSEEVRLRPDLRDCLAALSRDPVDRVCLPALPAVDVGVQIEDITGRRPSDELVATTHARSGGSPLLVEELVAAERAGVRGVPDHLRDTLLARVETLPADSQKLVAATAVRGAGCDDELLAAVLGWAPARVEEALAQSVRVGVLIVDAAEYRFRHELLREVVYTELLPGPRRELHARTAAALASSRAVEPATLAHHWYEAGDAELAAGAALTAAASAQRAHAPAAVHTQLERIVALWDDLSADLQARAGGRARLLEETAQAAALAGALARAVTLAEEFVAHGADAPTDLAVRCERLARWRWTIGAGDGAVAAYQRAIELLPGDAPPAVRARVLSGYAWFLAVSFQYDEATAVASAALRAADQSGVPIERCRALVSWAGAQSDPDEAAAAAVEGRDFALALEVHELAAQAYVALDGALRRRGAVRERAEALLTGLGQMPKDAYALRGYLAVYLVDGLISLGRWGEADALLDELAARGTQDMLAYYATAPRAVLAALRGQSSQARRCAADVATFAAGVPQQPYPAIIALLAEAEAALWDADPRAAATAGRRAVELASVDQPLTAAAITIAIRAWADLAERARRAGRPGEVKKAAAEAHGLFALLPEAGHEPVGRFATLARAELTRLEGPSDPVVWRAASAAWDQAEDPYRGSYTRWRLAEALLADRSGRAEARLVLAEARERASVLGAGPLLAAIEDLEARSRLRPAAMQPPSPAAAAAAALGLTPREHEVLTWVTAGRTNREIAAALWISPRTVGTHLSRVLRKLGVSTRTQVADAAHRLGLLPDD